MLSIREQIHSLKKRLEKVDIEKARIAGEIERLAAQLEREESPSVETRATSRFTPEEKIAIFKSLFRGREDVFPKRWDNQKTGRSGYSPACHHEWVKGICKKPKIKCSECPNQHFIPLTEEVIRKHLAGKESNTHKQDYTIGVYPMLKHETCWFLAVDFDKNHWQQDAKAFLETCRIRGVPASLERSRSGNGAHVWIFFSEPIPASNARKMGATLLTQTMERNPEIGFESYDRFFPNQDTMPSGGFGNLIALPLQHKPRQSNNSVFLNDDFEPYPDQWDYLNSTRRMTQKEVAAIAEEASSKEEILGVRMPLDEEDEKPWQRLPSRIKPDLPIDQKLPLSVELVLSNQIYVEKQNLPAVLINKIIRLAAFQNPDFYLAQAMRLSTFKKPRIIACAQDFHKHIGLPRGCSNEVIDLLKGLGIDPKVEDERNTGNPINPLFLGELTLEQKRAVEEMLKHDTGVLCATTAFGKTVVAAYILAARKTNTLIVVHRKQLLDQWVERLRTFLNLSADQIGMISGEKKHRPKGSIDVAMIQSLIRKNAVDERVANYGHIIVDECHHVSAVSFEAVVRATPAKYVLGLTASAVRKDGHHPIIFMQCGPIRYKVDAKHQAIQRPFAHKVVVQYTSFKMELPHGQKPTIQQLYTGIVEDNERNQMIMDDVLKALAEGRSPAIPALI